MPLIDEAKKKFDKNTFPSNQRGKKLDVSFTLKMRCGISPGDVIQVQSDIECNSVFGDEMGINTPVHLKKDDVALFLAIAYDAHIQKTVLVLIPNEHLAYYVYDEIPAGTDFKTLFTQYMAGNKHGY